jgi:hypothetical protein
MMAGGHPTLLDGCNTIPKGALVTLLSIALHDGRMKIAAGLPEQEIAIIWFSGYTLLKDVDTATPP